MMQTFIQKFRELPFRNYIYFSLGLSFLTIAAVLILKNFLPPEVPIFYGKPAGEAELTKTLGLLIAPGISIVALGMNTGLSVIATDVFVKKILIITGLVISLLTSITVTKIILLVGFF